MKTLFRTAIIPFILLAWMSNSCMEENTTNNDGTRIHFNLLSANNESLVNIPDGTSLAINFISADGQNVISFDNLGFQTTPSGFVTSTLTLPANNYTLSDCLLLNSDEKIVFAMPKFNSELASIASFSSPFDYKNSSAEVSIKLLDVTNHKPQEFGYQSFKNPNRGLSLIVTEKGSSKPVDATGYLMSGSDTLSQYSIKAGLNKVALPVELNASHALIIVRKSYAPYTLQLSTIERGKNKKPLRIVLEPALTINCCTDYYFSFTDSFEFYLGAFDGSVITINWGDGITETMEIPPLWSKAFSHVYPDPDNYRIIITGDLGNITLFQSGFGAGAIDNIDLRHLSELQEFNFGLSPSPAVLDFTSNTKLTTLVLLGLTKLERIYLPASHNIIYLELNGENRMTSQSVDAVIDNLYNNTIRKNIRNGAIGWAVSWVQEDESILGPPSATALAQAKIMKEQFGWSFWPDPFDNVSSLAAKEKMRQFREQKNVTRVKPL